MPTAAGPASGSVANSDTTAGRAARLLATGPIGLAVLDRRNRVEPYAVRRHLQLISDKIRALCLGGGREHGRRDLMIIMPPQHGKSVLCSIYTPAWFLAMFPSRRVLLASYEADFARSWGRAARDVMLRCAPVLGVSVAPDVAAAHHWETLAGGGMQTGGIGGPFSGKPADLAVIDDPLKNAEEAASPAIQERNWDWYQSVWRPRRQPNTVSLIVATRWNERDPIGRILAAEPDRWEVLHLPALAGPDDPVGRLEGEALWPERHSAASLERIRQTSPWWFETMYQGHPAPRTSGMFSTWPVVEAAQVPAPELVCRAWDLASTALRSGADPDWTVGVKMGMAGGGFTVLDVDRFREDPAAKHERICRVARADGPGVVQVIEQEPGSSGKDVVMHLARALPGLPVVGAPASGSKITRAELSAAKVSAGALVLARASWNDAWIDEHRSFPYGGHDDQVDAGSAALRWLVGTLEDRHDRMASWAPDEKEIFAWR